MVQQEPPGSEMAKAVNYCLNHWTALLRFLGRRTAEPGQQPVRAAAS
jgi:hypothetical protein